MNTLLERRGAVSIPATPPLVTKAVFVPDMSEQAPVRIASVLTNFGRWFFEKSESDTDSTTLEWLELQSNASNPTILTELGGVEKAETTLAAAYWMMTRQAEGQDGPL